MLAAERKDVLLAWLGADGRVRAAEAAHRFGVSLDTVRRDLQELAESGALRRVHGGALPPGPPGPPRVAERGERDRAAKAAIAAVAIDLLRAGEVVALSGGTTTIELARRLPRDLEITVVTTSPDVALALAAHRMVAVDVTGGRLDAASRTLTGPDAIDALRHVCPDTCVLSACSVHLAAGLTYRDKGEAQVVTAMLEHAGRVIGVITAEKLGTSGPYHVGDAARLDVLVTDAAADVVAPYEALGIEVLSP